MAGAPDFRKIVGRLKAYPIAIAAGLLTLVFAIVLFLRSSSISALEFSLQEKESEWNRVSGNLKRARDLEAHLARIQEYEGNVNGRLMDPEERALNYDYFYALEAESGVSLASLNQGGVVETKNSNEPGIKEFKTYRLVGYNLAVEGDFDSVVEFLSLLANGEYFARISSFSVARAPQAAAGTLTVNLQMQVLGTPHES